MMSIRLASVSSTRSAGFDPNEISLSVNLIERTRHLLDFLSEVLFKPELHEGPLVDCAVQRYERYWLPLVAKHPGRLLPAPLDIEWVWHCHMLCPEAYSSDCCNIVGKVVDHHLIDRAQRKELLKDSERLWRIEYTDVPFSTCDAITPWFDCEFVSALTYSLASAVFRQRTFYYQVSLPHYRDDKFLTNALLRYKKFLILKLHNPGMLLVPCCDTELIWRTHMLHPHLYKDDMLSYLGDLLPHPDALTDRSSSSKITLHEAKTRNMWRKVFNEKYSCFGAMYRGEPPYSKLYALSKEDISSICTKKANVLIERIRISGLPLGRSYKLKLCYNTGYQNFSRSLFVTENIITLKGNSRTFADNKINTHFQFDTRYNDKITVVLRQKSGRLCLGSCDIVGEGRINLLKKIQPLNNRGMSTNDDIECDDGMTIEFVWSCPSPTLGPCVLRLEPGAYQSCVMPEDRESIWGPIPLPRLPAGVDNVCSVASHKLYNHTKKVVFTVRMIHSEPLLMSAVHVFHGDKLSAVSHLVVGDQLPLPEMVNDTKKCVTLNPREGQRAVLVKNHSGDWGIVVGWWEGFHRRVAGRKGSCSEGHLEVRFFHLPNKQWHYVSIDRLYSLATSKFTIGDSIVEFDSGFIEIDSQRAEISENLALIFSVALIHVLCQPRPVDWSPKLDTPGQLEDDATPRLGGSEDITLLLAAGVLIATPCNQAIRNLFKKRKQKFGECNHEIEENHQKKISSCDQNGGPGMILHGSSMSSGWGNSWRESSNSTLVNHAESTLLMGGLLTSIKEQVDSDSDDGAGNLGYGDRKVEITEADVIGVTDQTALLTVGDDNDEDERDCDVMGLLNISNQNEDDLHEENAQDRVENEEEFDDEEEVESDRQSEGVFEVDDYNLDADSQTGLFGNGEDDSDEILGDGEAEEESESKLDDEEDLFIDNQSFDNDQTLEKYPDFFDQNEDAFDNDADNYYDEFYNIDGDDTGGGFQNTDFNGGINQDHTNDKNVWDIYGGDNGNIEHESNTDLEGFLTSKYEEFDKEDTSFSFGKYGEGQDASDGSYSHFSSGLICDANGDVDYGGADSCLDIYSDSLCNGGAGSCIEAGGAGTECGF